MTSQKHLKNRIRARMARTGERYTAARRHVLAASNGDGRAAGPGTHATPATAGDVTVVDHGHPLRGGVHPESAIVSALLARHGVTVSEAMALGVGGGLGAGYILWEFAAHGDARHLVLGFRHRWNYLDWTENALARLGATTDVATTGGAKGAAAALRTALRAGRPAVVWPDRFTVGYWGLPRHLDGHGGHAVLAYALTDDGVRVDDRTAAPLTVAHDVLDAARARVSSYRNRLVTVTDVAEVDLAAAIRAGIADTLAGLGGTSSSFSLPAWRKWAKLVTDERNAKGWPRVFADGRGLTGALLTVWEEVEPMGMSGGSLRALYADFLDEAAGVLGAPDLAACAPLFRDAGARWHDVAEAALPDDVPAHARLRDLTAEIAMGVAAGDDGADARAAATTELWALRAELDAAPPVAPDLGRLAAAVGAAHAAEAEAVDRMRAAAATL